MNTLPRPDIVKNTLILYTCHPLIIYIKNYIQPSLKSSFLSLALLSNIALAQEQNFKEPNNDEIATIVKHHWNTTNTNIKLHGITDSKIINVNKRKNCTHKGSTAFCDFTVTYEKNGKIQKQVLYGQFKQDEKGQWQEAPSEIPTP